MRELRLNGQGLTAVPRAVFEHADTLELLDLSDNDLNELPDELTRLKRLRILFASNNRFTELPAVLGACAQLEMVGFKSNAIAQLPAASLPQRLRWLILTDNALTALPPQLGERPRLQKLMLAGNRLDALPDSLRHAHALELLRIAANRFSALPDWLPSLPRLAWLAWGGNPMTAAAEQAALRAAASRAMGADALHIGDRLGEGASGVIHRARWQTPNGAQEVAIKRFKGSVTSDGWPHSEMAASLTAGANAALVPVHGLMQARADAPAALVMQALPPRFRPLAGPPSFASCTRDVYPDALTLSLHEVQALARGVAGAMAQLHARGLVHGDLYAHNLLWDGARPMLSDFGAASFLPPAQPALHAALRALDVRAFGILLGECSGRMNAIPAQHIAKLQALAMHCIGSDAATPVGFDSILELLSLM